MSRIAIKKNKIDPDHLEYLKQRFNSKTNAGAICKLIEYFCNNNDADNEIVQQKMRDLVHKSNQFELLKEYINQKEKYQNKITQIINE